MRDFLVGIAILHRRHMPAGKSDDRGMAEVRILHRRRKIGGPNRLGHADARTSSDARVAIRHVTHGLFRMTQDTSDAKVFHFRQCAAQYGVHEKNMIHAIRLEQLREISCPGNFFCH